MIFSLQEERVLIYKEFSNSFKDYVNDIRKNDDSASASNLVSSENVNFIQFRFICKQITEKFNKISSQIIKIKELLVDHKELLKLVEKLQEYEENKFKLVKNLFLFENY